MSDSSVSNLFRARMDQWSTNVRPYSVGAVFMAWVQKQEREGELTKLVKECGGDSVKGEIEEIMRGRTQ